MKITPYLFKQKMANELNGTLYSNVERISGVTYQTIPHDEEYFLKEVVTPIYNVLYEVTHMFFLPFTLALHCTALIT